MQGILSPVYEKFDALLTTGVALIFKDRDEEAHKFFSEQIYPMYEANYEDMNFKRLFIPLYVSIDEYLNSSVNRETGLASKERVLAEYGAYSTDERLEVYLPRS